MKQTRTERIKQAIKVSFITGILIGGIGGGSIGYHIGTGNLHIELPKQQYTDCIYGPCDENCPVMSKHDEQGNVYNDNPYNWHCNNPEHGDGHECYGIDY